MNVNATLFVQMLFFITFIAITMKYIWPPVTEALEKRRKEIADGLADAERARKSLVDAEATYQATLAKAKTESSHIIDQANRQAQQIVDEAKERARTEGERLLQVAQGEIEQRYVQAKSELMQQVSHIVIAGAEKILQKEVDKASNDRLIRELVSDEI